MLPDSAEVDDGRLIVGGCDVADLAREFGTPLFVYDEEHLRVRCREAVSAFGPDVAYASKAFLCTAMARLVHEEGMRIDVSTGGEMYVALHAGVPPERIVFHGNNKSTAEIEVALGHGVGRIVLDSWDEIDRIEALVESGAAAPSVLLLSLIHIS
ncbi:MAG: diaminopimelate decarboxylase, partial [Actinomycetia bacterium]|nr:diaminopimelate decarboxylase [Actinomycetes bacterium]